MTGPGAEAPGLSLFMPKMIWSENTLTVVRESGDPRFYGTAGGAGESRFLHWLKKILNSEGRDLIKKRMWKDGHLVDDMQQYIRVRNIRPNCDNVALYNDHWAICGLNDDFNQGKAVLSIARL